LFTSMIVRIVDACRRNAIAVVLSAFTAVLALSWFTAVRFSINTDVNHLLADDLDWRKREKELEKAFPRSVDRLVVVIDGDNADAAETAAARLAEKMLSRPDLFRNVIRPDSIPFFRKNGLLFLPRDRLEEILNVMVQAQPLLGTLARDPSLRGLFGAFDLVMEGLKRGDVRYEDLDKPFTLMAETVEVALGGREKPLPWRSLMSEGAASKHDLRKFIITQPVLDFEALSPGAKASRAVREMAREAGVAAESGTRVRLTGPVALNDEEFASVAEGAALATILSVVLVFMLLFMALWSFRLIVPIIITLFAGLVATTAFAMAAIGSLNLISVAFAVMFVGIAVDFGIQFGVRFRDRRHVEPDVSKAMSATAETIAKPLAIAAAMTSLGFLAFTPTDYRGVAELGLIAGVGMIIAYLLSITLLPALLIIFKPPAEPEPVGYAWAAPIDRFLTARRSAVIAAAAICCAAGLFFASQIRFDFDPLNLKDPRAESVQTLFDLMKDPDSNPYAVEILKPSLAEAEKTAEKIAALPQADRVMTLASFVPEDQEEKLAMIEEAGLLLAPTLNPTEILPAPVQDEVIAALDKAAAALEEQAGDRESARRLAAALRGAAGRKDATTFGILHSALIGGMEAQLETVRESLTAQRVTIDSITPDLRDDWIAPDGRALVKAYPKNFPKDGVRDSRILSEFTAAVESVEPEAGGSPVSIQKSGQTIVASFMKAGVSGVFVISLFAMAVLRRARDVMFLIAPLILAGILTLATMVIISLPLNFANIIALPLLLSLGVSYSVYFVTAWREGARNLLQSSMARAVLFSAATTTVAFGSLSLSSHPGTAGMGKLLTIAVLYCLLCTFLVLPALLGVDDTGRKQVRDSE